MGKDEPNDSTSGPAAQSAAHPDYPSLPLANALAYEHGTMINLEYPGLQLVFQSPHGSPFFIVPNFLSDVECDAFMHRCAGELIPSRAAQNCTSEIPRDSRHVRVVKSETRAFHERVARLTNHRVENFETTKLIRYERGEEFSLHMDPQASPHDMVSLDGRPLPEYVNRELTLFVYLNSPKSGGETAFFRRDEATGRYTENFRVKPERGLAVLFYASLQPPSGVLPADTSGYMDRQCLRDRHSVILGARRAPSPRRQVHTRPVDLAAQRRPRREPPEHRRLQRGARDRRADHLRRASPYHRRSAPSHADCRPSTEHTTESRADRRRGQPPGCRHENPARVERAHLIRDHARLRGASEEKRTNDCGRGGPRRPRHSSRRSSSAAS